MPRVFILPDPECIFTYAHHASPNNKYFPKKEWRIKSEIYHHDIQKNINVEESWGHLKYKLITNSLGFRDFENNEMNFEGVTDLLNGKCKPKVLSMEPGCLVLFRGRNAVHRVTPSIGNRVRVLSVLAYNSEPGVQLSETARKTFFGKLY